MSSTQGAIPLDRFLTAMTSRMTQYGNVITPESRAIWQQMADTFNTKIANHGERSNRSWKCLTPPTGTGKTTGLAVYCSLLPEAQDNIGVLIVCRQIKQVDELAQAINELSQQKLAWAHHSQHRLTDEERFQAQVLITTHAAYRLALEEATVSKSTPQLDALNWWDGGLRKLTVIDEALDVISHHQVKVEEVFRVYGSLPQEIREHFPEEGNILLKVGQLMTELSTAEDANSKQGKTSPTRMMDELFDTLPETLDGVDFGEMKNRLRAYHHAHRWKLPKEELEYALNALDGVASMINRWTYFHKSGNRNTLNSAGKIIPPDLGDGPVVLDATARANRVWNLFGQQAEIIPPSAKARSYRNVTLHVCRDYADVGKYPMQAKANIRTANLIKWMSENLDHGSKVFVCSQKQVEQHLIGIDTPFDAFSTAHFGATDGLNEWSNFDTCVIFGLPHKPNTWSLNNLLAFGHEKSDEYLNSEECKEWKKVLKGSSLITDCIQIMNRVRCRRLLDVKGNCDPTDIFILIPSGKDGDELLTGLEREMPDVVIQDWKIQLDDETTKRPRVIAYEDRLLAFCENIGAGCEVSATEFRKVSGISPSSWDRLVISLKDETSELSSRLRGMNIRFVDNHKPKKANRKSFARDNI